MSDLLRAVMTNETTPAKPPSTAEWLHLLDQSEPTWGELAEVIGVTLRLPEVGEVVGVNPQTVVQLYWPEVPPPCEEAR